MAIIDIDAGLFEIEIADGTITRGYSLHKTGADYSAYPGRWIGKVAVETRDGRRLAARVDEPRGDPGNTLNRHEISTKAALLARFGGAHDQASADKLVERLWTLSQADRVGWLLG